jgi:HSP20 family protein
MFELTPFVKRNNAAVYDPFRLFDEMERNFFKGSSIGEFRADIRDTGDAYELEADLPGVKKEDIQVELDNNYLTISAERHAEKDEKDKKGNYVRRERSYGSYSRSFDVTGVQTDQITAEYTDGVLKLRLPKKQESLPTTRRLEIR